MDGRNVKVFNLIFDQVRLKINTFIHFQATLTIAQNGFKLTERWDGKETSIIYATEGEGMVATYKFQETSCRRVHSKM